MLAAVSFVDQIGLGNGADSCMHYGILPSIIRDDFQVRDGQTVYAYEVDGLGNQLVDFDDPNIPSLMSIPLLGYGRYDETIYRATRDRLFNHNPYYVRCVYPLCIGVLEISDIQCRYLDYCCLLRSDPPLCNARCAEDQSFRVGRLLTRPRDRSGTLAG